MLLYQIVPTLTVKVTAFDEDLFIVIKFFAPNIDSEPDNVYPLKPVL